MENQILCHSVMGINKMKGKPDVSNEESHIPLHFLVVKEAAQLPPWVVGTGPCTQVGAPTPWGPCFFLPQDYTGALGLTHGAGCSLGMQWHS